MQLTDRSELDLETVRAHPLDTHHTDVDAIDFSSNKQEPKENEKCGFRQSTKKKDGKNKLKVIKKKQPAIYQ